MSYAMGDSIGGLFNAGMNTQRMQADDFWRTLQAQRQGADASSQAYLTRLQLALDQNAKADAARRQDEAARRQDTQFATNLDLANRGMDRQDARETARTEREDRQAGDNYFSSLYDQVLKGNIPNIPTLKAMTLGRLTPVQETTLTDILGNQQQQAQIQHGNLERMAASLNRDARNSAGYTTALTAQNDFHKDTPWFWNTVKNMGFTMAPGWRAADENTRMASEKAAATAKALQDARTAQITAHKLGNQLILDANGNIVPVSEAPRFTDAIPSRSSVVAPAGAVPVITTPEQPRWPGYPGPVPAPAAPVFSDPDPALPVSQIRRPQTAPIQATQAPAAQPVLERLKSQASPEEVNVLGVTKRAIAKSLLSGEYGTGAAASAVADAKWQQARAEWIKRQQVIQQMQAADPRFQAPQTF